MINGLVHFSIGVGRQVMNSAQRVRAILSFVQAADSGSFAAAARVLKISSAAVSKNVAGLERSLGVRLMNRTTRTLKLTAEGTAFLGQARIALDALETAVNTVSQQRNQPSGCVRISTSAVFGCNHIMPALPKLLARHPGLSVEMDFDDRVIDLVREGYDLAVRGGNISDSALVARHVCTLNTVLVAAPAYLASRGAPETPHDLNTHQLIARRFLGGRSSKWTFRLANGDFNTIEPLSNIITVSSPEASIQAALLGLGIAQVGVHLAWPHLRSRALKVVLNDHHHPGDYKMVIQYAHRALLAPRVRSTVDHLLKAFADDELLHVPLEALANYSA